MGAKTGDKTGLLNPVNNFYENTTCNPENILASAAETISFSQVLRLRCRYIQCRVSVFDPVSVGLSRRPLLVAVAGLLFSAAAIFPQPTQRGGPSGLGAHALRYLVATKPREVRVRKLRGL